MKNFFIILVLFLNLFDIAKAEEFVRNSPALEKDSPAKVSKKYTFSEIVLEDSSPVDSAESLFVESNKDKETENRLNFNNSNEDGGDKIHLASAKTSVTLGIFSPLLLKSEKGGVWIRPYASFEQIPLENGPSVKSFSYGSLIGIDSDPKNLKNNWQVVNSGYLGYTGSQQSYDDVRQTQMSGFGGVYSTFYKKNFFSAVVLTAGGNVVKSNDSQDIVGINAGLITRTGYNIKLPHNIVVQPNYIMSYTFDNNFNYRNNKGELVQDKPLSIIHIIPSIRVFANLKGGWQPFVIVNMNFNAFSKGEVTVNRVASPTAYVKPYIEYGGGFQKSCKEDCSMFFQALAKSGGRNGIAFLAGFRWAFNDVKK